MCLWSPLLHTLQGAACALVLHCLAPRGSRVSKQLPDDYGVRVRSHLQPEPSASLPPPLFVESRCSALPVGVIGPAPFPHALRWVSLRPPRGIDSAGVTCTPSEGSGAAVREAGTRVRILPLWCGAAFSHILLASVFPAWEVGTGPPGSWLQSRTQRRSARRRNGVVWLQLQATDPDPPCPHPHPAVAPRLLRPGDPDTAARRGQHQVPQHRGHVCYLGVCRTHRLAEIIQWIRSASTKEPSGKARREPQDPYSYGRRRWREAEARLGSQDSGLQRGGQRSAQLAG